MDLDQIRAVIDAATASYTGDPVEVPLSAQVSLKALHAAVEEYRGMGWTVSYELNPLRLIVS